MENFFNYISKPVSNDEVQTWLEVNNIIQEKVELYYDFVKSLHKLISETYLGFDEENNEEDVKMTSEDNLNHFIWCWKKTINSFEKENIRFNNEGEHFEHFKSFFDQVFYEQKDIIIKKQIPKFFDELFDLSKPFTRSDLDILTDLYRSLNKNLII